MRSTSTLVAHPAVLESGWLRGLIITLCAVLSFPVIARGNVPSVPADQLKSQRQTAHQADSTFEAKVSLMQGRLAAAKTSADSIIPLFNLHDLYFGSEQGNAIGWQLVETARRAGNEPLALDALRNIANYNLRNDSVISLALLQAKKFPASRERTHTITFIRIIQNNSRALYSTPEVKEKQLQNLLQQLSLNPPTDLYERIVLLHTLCVNLSEFSNGDLLADYLQKLGELIEEANPEDHALRNSFYVWASMIYTKVKKPALALDACLKLLGEIDLLDQRNRQIGRIYRSYDANRYIVYGRMLQNYQALLPDEIELYHGRVKEIVARDTRAARTYAAAPLPSVYYYFAKKDYRKTFDLLHGRLDDQYFNFSKRDILRMYIESAEALGEREALLEIYPAYTAQLEETLDNRQQERYRELQVLYDVNDMKIRNLRLKEEKLNAQKVMWRTVTIVCALLLAALTVFIIILLRLNRRRAQLATKLERSNHDLAHQRDSLRNINRELKEARDEASKANHLKTEFINNMSHEVRAPLQAMTEYAAIMAENTDDDRRQFMKDFADRLQLNCSMVSTIVNDVLQLADLHSSTLTIDTRLFDSAPICAAAADAVRSTLKPGVELIVDAENFIFRTDRHRLLQILNNLLNNAAKFTSHGSVTIACRKDEARGKAIFTVTDTGIGISPAESEHIFERFRKIDSTTPGAGIGLTIARMIAELMGGTLVLDTDYNAPGSRFVLSLPLEA